MREKSITLAVAFLSVAAFPTWGQVQTGLPGFGSFTSSSFDTVNNANLNVHFEVPIAAKAGRGVPFTYSLAYDSSVWYPSSSSGVSQWTATPNWGWSAITQAALGYITYSVTVETPCTSGPGGTPWSWDLINNFQYIDSFGTRHSYGQLQFTYVTVQGSGTSCVPSYPNPATATISDGSPYTTMYALVSSPTSVSAFITSNSGFPITPPVGTGVGGGTYQDNNGNFISAVYSSGTTTFTDTLATTALSVTGSNPMDLNYTNPSGGTSQYKVNYSSYPIKTAFGCSGIGEASTTASLVSSIDLPDGTLYSFTYEVTPGSPSTYTGRLASVKLPTGGTITYAYSGGSNGITCADGSTATLVRTTPDIIATPWTYAHSESGTNWTTTLTDPSSSTTTMTFSGIYEQSRVVKTGMTTLKTTYTCYNGQAFPCSSGGVTLPISSLNVYTVWPNVGGRQAGTIISENASAFDSWGNLTEFDEYNYGATGSSSPGPMLRKTVSVYPAGGLGNGIYNRPSSTTVTDETAGTVTSQTVYLYDQGTPQGTSASQHNSVSGARGNLTTVERYVTPTVSLNWQMSYYDTGNVYQIIDPNTAKTTQTFGNCNQAFVTNIAMPLSLSRNYTWDCNGAVQLTETDENSQLWTWTYGDPNFWRLSSFKDPTLAVTYYSYPTSQTQSESRLAFNGTTSVVDILTTLDGLGRPSIVQQEQSPSSTNYDSVQTSYDTFGRPSKVTLPYSALRGIGSGSAGTTIAYDALNRVTQVMDGGTGYVQYSYPANNDDILVTIGPAASGENTKQRLLEYDPLGRIFSVCEISTLLPGNALCGQNTQETGFLTVNNYDASDNVITITQNIHGGTIQTRTYAYDELSRMTSESNPETGPISYWYDSDSFCGSSSAGDLVKKKDAMGNVTCYFYDLLHRVTAMTYPSGPYAGVTPEKHFVYDAASVNGFTMSNVKNRLAEAYTGPSTGKITDEGFSYSVRGDLTDTYQYSPHTGSGYAHLSASYWANGSLNVLTSNLTGLPTLTFFPDGEGRVSTITPGSGQSPVTSTVYNTAGLVTGVTYGSGDSDSFGFDPNTLRPTSYVFNANGVTQSGTITNSTNGNVQKLAVMDNIHPAGTQTCSYTYDDLNRVVADNCATAWGAAYTIGPLGNMTKSTIAGSPGTTFLPTYNSNNQFATLPSGTPSYDGNGNLTYDGFHTYGWDADGNLIMNDGNTGTFDALDRRVELGASSGYRQMLYPPFDPTFQMGGANGLSANGIRIPLPGQGQAYFVSTGLNSYRHANWQGSEPLLTFPVKTTPPSYGSAFTPFGERYDPYSSGSIEFFAGMVGIANTAPISDSYQANARLYNMFEGRWISPDPAGLAAVDLSNPQTLNRYAYVANNPLNAVDPGGELQSFIPPNGPPEEGPGSGFSLLNPIVANCGGGWLWNDFDFAGQPWFLPCPGQTNYSFAAPQHGGGGGGGGTSVASNNPYQMIKCTGVGRGLAGNANLIGKQGGIPGQRVQLNTAAVTPTQFNVPNGAALSPFAPYINGTVGNAFFKSVTDVNGGKSPIPGVPVRTALQHLFPGQLILEIPGAKDQGANAPVTINVPQSLGCPAGTHP